MIFKHCEIKYLYSKASQIIKYICVVWTGPTRFKDFTEVGEVGLSTFQFSPTRPIKLTASINQIH